MGREQGGVGIASGEDAAGRLAAIRARIAAAAREAGRDPGAVTLVAVSKTFPAAAIEPVLMAGQRVFGENRVQEAAGKWPALRERDRDVELHLIGPLQTNKVREAVALFDAIHTLDRPKLAAALAREIDRSGRQRRLFVEVNTGAEPQKAGVLPEDADAFIAACRRDYGLPVSGLMCIPPADEAAAPHFALLGKLAARNGLAALSMGMSADFESAVRLGATHVRVGSAIFGPRAGR
jgi:pyridoxal phosphate enzyme (YggS family)